MHFAISPVRLYWFRTEMSWWCNPYPILHIVVKCEKGFEKFCLILSALREDTQLFLLLIIKSIINMYYILSNMCITGISISFIWGLYNVNCIQKLISFLYFYYDWNRKWFLKINIMKRRLILTHPLINFPCSGVPNLSPSITFESNNN